MFKIIVAYDKNKTIGYKGWMPWDLPEDLAHFKAETLNHNLIMGSTTFYGLKKPLPNRTTYVLSSKEVNESENVKWIKDLEKFIKDHKDSEEVFYVCGGASIYKQFFPYTKELIVSYVYGEYPSDTKFLDFDESKFSIKTLKEYDDFKVLSFLRLE